jgi:hypothetical protein
LKDDVFVPERNELKNWAKDKSGRLIRRCFHWGNNTLKELSLCLICWFKSWRRLLIGIW